MLEISHSTMRGSLALLALSSFLCITTISSAVDTINSTQSLQGNQTLVSADGSFELGFFHGDDPYKQYLGMWYKKLPTKTVVWVANRETPIGNSSGTLKLTNQGVLTLLDHNETIVWSSEASRDSKPVQNPVAQLLSTGNMIVRDRDDDDNNEENFLWQSFDYPSDTLLPGAKLGRVLATGFDRFLTSWKSPGDPSPGDYTYRVNPNGYPQLFLSQGSVVKFSTGPWNGLRFSGVPNLNQNPVYSFGFVLDEKEMYYNYQLLNNSILSKMILSSNGIIQRYIWIDRTQGWRLYLTAPIDSCDAYGLCGSYGSCNVVNSPVCECLKGFVPKIGEEWERMDWSNGCARRTSLNCSEDVFLKYSGVKLPDTQRSWYNTTMNLEECKATCRKNCNCTAYANLDIRGGGSGCLLWFGDLVDIREYNENGQDLYLRMAASEAGMLESRQNQKKRRVIIVSSTTGVISILGLCLIMVILCKKGLCGQGGSGSENEKEDVELPLFDFMTIAAAANNFSEDNKVGQGGFGPVYKGKLKDGQEIAVKMLSSNSNQGINEFKNEVTCIAKLQHRNLVKLLGYCIQEEKMLLYEYMPNKSLDFFIFDQAQRKLLDWDKRFNIINGIARGVMYLHQDSRLRVIHRDLKASNVLLDHEMNPKISDFGTARSFGGNETAATTDRVVGTYGYMSPEYAIDGNFSTKSDVFSYGVLLLEIVSGKRNRGFYHPEHRLNLLGHAWKLFKEGRTLELIDALMDKSCDVSEALRSIHVGLLCVQRCPEDRPSMSYVVLLLTSDITLPPPKEPGFYNEREMFHPEDTLSSKQASSQDEEMTSTILSGR